MGAKKVPHIKISAGFYFKNSPKGYLGLQSESCTIGNKPASFDSLIIAFIYCFLEFYIMVMQTPIDEINAGLQKLAEAISNLRVEETNLRVGENVETQDH